MHANAGNADQPTFKADIGSQKSSTINICGSPDTSEIGISDQGNLRRQALSAPRGAIESRVENELNEFFPWKRNQRNSVGKLLDSGF